MKRPARALCCGLFLSLLGVGLHVRGAEPTAARPRRGFQLANGLQVTLVPQGAEPIVALRVLVHAATVHEPPDAPGLAEFTGELLREGTTGRDAGKLSTDLAAMGGEPLEVRVGPDLTTLAIEVGSEFAADGVALLAEVLQEPGFPTSRVEPVRERRLRALDFARQDPQLAADRQLDAALYPDHPYGRPLPSEAATTAHTAEQARAFHRDHFGARRAHLFVVGSVDEAIVERAVRDRFAGWRPGPGPRAPRLAGTPGPSFHLIDRPGSPLSVLRVGVRVVPPAHADYVPLVVTDALLGGSFGSRITSNLRRRRGWAYSPTSSIDTRHVATHWTVRADVITEITGPALHEIFHEIDRLQQKPPTAEELARVQSELENLFALQRASREGVLRQLTFLALHGLPADFVDGYVSSVRAVTPERVLAIARRYLQPEAMTVVIVGDRGEVTPQLEAFLQSQNGP